MKMNVGFCFISYSQCLKWHFGTMCKAQILTNACCFLPDQKAYIGTYYSFLCGFTSAGALSLGYWRYPRENSCSKNKCIFIFFFTYYLNCFQPTSLSSTDDDDYWNAAGIQRFNFDDDDDPTDSIDKIRFDGATAKPVQKTEPSFR